MAFTTLPAKDGCRSPKKLMPRPSGRTDVSTRDGFGLGDSLRLHGLAGLHPRPGTSGRPGKHCPDLRGRARCWAAFPRLPESISPAGAPVRPYRAHLASGRRRTERRITVQRGGVSVVRPLQPTPASGIRRNGCLLRTPSKLLRDSACSWANRSGGGDRRWSRRPRNSAGRSDSDCGLRARRLRARHESRAHAR